MPHIPFLGHADERGINDALAVRMIVAAGVARNLCALHPPRSRPKIQIVHRHQNPPLRWLQPIPRIGQRPADDHAHRVRQVALFQLVFDRLIDQSAGIAAGRRRRFIGWNRGQITVSGQSEILSRRQARKAAEKPSAGSKSRRSNDAVTLPVLGAGNNRPRERTRPHKCLLFNDLRRF